MTSTIKVNTITTESGSTLTVGGCGKTVALATGASQTGFGRTGTVDWQTGSIKTATFTAVSGEGYFCNTAGGSFEVDLPAGSAGAIVSVQDYNNTFDSNSLAVDPNGSEKINGGTAGAVVTLNTEGQGVTFVYIDATVGWRSVQDNQFSQTGAIPTFICASVSGSCNTLVTAPDCANTKIATFKGPGNFTVSSISNVAANNEVSYLVVAGGGGTSGLSGNNSSQGGAGAGGFRETKSPVTPYTASPLDGYGTPTNRITVTATAFPIAVGAGGAGGASGLPNPGANGSVSTFSTISSAGGGKGGSYGPSWNPASSGGSGGGGNGQQNAAGAGNTPPVSPPQGNDGGAGLSTPGKCGAAGGGGAGAAGNSPPGSCYGATGGIGAGTAINTTVGTPGPSGSLSYFAGGGGGAPYASSPTIPGVAGGGAGTGPNQSGTAGTTNTGGGASSGGTNATHGAVAGATGGSGIVIIRYRFQ